jgi:PLP dependent protein
VLSERIEQVEERIHRAVARAGRRRADVTLIAVTKKFPAAVMIEAYELGLRHFGENYVQEFETKHPALVPFTDAEFHMIGHVQGNKARIAAELFHVIETVDSAKLARRLEQGAKPLEVMIEVKLSEEESKAGCAPGDLSALIHAIRDCPRLCLTGFMTMPPWCDDPEQTRPYFRHLAELARQHGLPKLSMGMSHDFEAAIEEGSTHIRVGTALFGPRQRAL